MGQHTNLIRGFPNAARLTRGELVFRLVLFHTVMLAALACSSRSAAVQQASPELLTASPTENVIVEPVDWIFLIDTSASMAGLGRGTTDIFPRVQQTLREFVSALRDEDSLTVFVFDSTSRLESSTAIKSSADRAGIITRIDQLTAEGRWTHTGAALKDALQNVASRANPKRTAAIILLTDGKEDIKGIENPIRIDDAIKLIPDQNVPYIFYVSLGTARDPQLSNFIDSTNNKVPGRGHILEDPRAQDLPRLASDIRTRVRTAATPPALKIQPETLDLGEIEPGGDSGPYSIDVSSGIKTTLTLAPTGVPPEHHLEGLPDTLEVDPRHVKRVTFRLKLGEGATEGVQNFSVVISPPAGLGLTTQKVPITLVVHEGISTWLSKRIYAHWHHLLLVLLIISILLVLLFLAREWLYRERTPLDIVRDLRRNTGGERTAVLSTPDGPIHLDKPKITLGRGGSKLPNSSATMEINREGAYHIIEVKEGSITITDPLHEVQDSLEAGNKQRLKNRDQLLMPGYPSPIVYLNTSRKH